MNRSLVLTNPTILSDASLLDDSSDLDYNEPKVRDSFILVLYMITAIVAMTGNIFICVVIYKKKWLKSTTYVLIFNMAISDIIGGFVIPGQFLFCSTLLLDSGNIGKALCFLMKSLQMLSYYVSSLTMTAIAFDRFQLICRPMRPRVRVSILLFPSWIFGILFISGNFVTLRVTEYFSPTRGLITCRMLLPTETAMFFRKFRVLFLMITQYFIPLGMVSVFYYLVMRRIWAREQIAGANCNEKKQTFDEKKKRTIIMLIVVTVLFGLSYIPTHVYHYMMFFTKIIQLSKKGTCHSSTAYMFSYWLGISSCAYNPFIYCYFNAEFKREAIKYLRMIFCCCGRFGGSEDFNTNSNGGGRGPSSDDSNISSKMTDCAPSQDSNGNVNDPGQQMTEVYRKSTVV